MRKPIQIISLFLILIMLSACGTTPAETTPPSTTAPAVTEPVETTVPPTTEPPIPEGFVCLNEMFEGSDITITVEGSDIILDEDGLVLKMSTEHVDVYRDIFIVGVMRKKPIVENDLVYIHGQFYDYFFCKEGTDWASLFYGIRFYPKEACEAVENPDASVFNQKLCAEILLPQSMGITIPHIDDSRIFRDDAILHIGFSRTSELASYGYTDTYIWNEYLAIRAGQTLKAAGISDDDTMTVGEYERQEEKRKYQAFLANELTEEKRAFLEQKGVSPTDYESLISHFHGDSLFSATDADLRSVIENYCCTSLIYLGKSIYEKYFPPDPLTNPAEISAMVINYENMTIMELREWFYEFARAFRVDYLPRFPISMGPPNDSQQYLFWVATFTSGKREYGNLTREYVDEIVMTYFGITPENHRTWDSVWIYAPKTQAYTPYPAGSPTDVHNLYFLLTSVVFEDGIYTIHGTEYHAPWRGVDIETELRYKTDLLAGNNKELTAYYNITVSFRLDPETNLPVFCGYVDEYLIE